MTWLAGTLARSMLILAFGGNSSAMIPQAGSTGKSGVAVEVTDSDSKRGIPCRITVVDDQGRLAPLSVAPGSRLAARTGVVYTGNGRARIELAPGRYVIYAGRGFEYGLAEARLTLLEDQTIDLSMSIRREVPTDGLIACDTHVHTFTHSGHGDASVDERALTLAGEGVELPIATDHDHLTIDLGDAARRMGVESDFTPVIGDEVTTPVGHFNAFPLPGNRPAPGHTSTDWWEILQGIRSSPGERVVVLNHPRDLHGRFRPFDLSHFNPVTGEHRRGNLGVNAIEVINSGAMQSDPMVPILDWMAVLNHGERLAAVGASDSHDVAKHIVGQGRTYVYGRDEDPSRIDVEAAARNIREGRALVSLGLLAKVTVDGRSGPGDLATGLGDRVQIHVDVLGPSWTAVDRLEVFANGVRLFDEREAREVRPGVKLGWDRQIPRPRHDLHLVVVASGPGVTGLYWPIEQPFQPTSSSYTPRVLAITNPVFLDGDGDGRWTSPRRYAETLIKGVGADPARLLAALADYDEAVASQAASLCQAAGHDVRHGEFPKNLAGAAEPVRRGFARFASTLPAKP